jgi:hypothetical protein
MNTDVHAIVSKEPKFSFRSDDHFTLLGVRPDIKPSTIAVIRNYTHIPHYCNQPDLLNTVINNITKAQAFSIFIEKGDIDYSVIKQCPELLDNNFKNIRANLVHLQPYVEPKYAFPILMQLGKKHHLWLHGPPSSGKTALKTYLEKEIKMSMGINNGWWDEKLLDNDCVTVWFDEIQKNQITSEQLNLLCNGDMMINIKHGFQHHVKKTIQVVVTSN